MAKKIIKVRLFTWFEETASLVKKGETVLTERIAHLGEEVDITNKDYLERGEQLNAFYTDAEAKKIKDGTYKGADAPILFSARQGQGFAPPAAAANAADGEHGDVASMDAPTLAEYIKEHKLNIDSTVALAGDDAESIQKVLDAENIASDNDPRAGVVSKLEAKLTALD
jgi:hypothetical protein